MTHALGVYYAPEHGFKVDRDYIAALQPPVIRILDPDVQHIADMHALAPNAIIAPRTWAIDDGSDEAHPSRQVNRLMADPVGTGRDHAQQYKGQWDRWQQEAAQRGLKLPPVERILFNSANEPNQGGTPDKIAVYCVAFLDRCTELGIRACGPCLGVGWPDNNGPDTPVDWSPYANAGLEQAIKRNGGMLSVHEYFYKSGPQDGWRWWAGRHLQCPFDVPILLGEIGIDNYVDTKRWANEGGNRGWQGNVSPDQYAEMIQYHLSHSDRRVVASLPFITDFRNNSWESFNTRPAHDALLARKDRMIPQSKPIETRLPSIENGKPTAIVDAPAGANIRSGPGLDYPVLGTEIYGQAMPIIGRNGDWWQVDLPHVTGWVNGMIVKTYNVGNVPVEETPTPVKPVPVESPGIIDPVTALAFLDVESGNSPFVDGLLTIRFEVHVFKKELGNDELFNRHFQFVPGDYSAQFYRISEQDAWKNVHGSMALRHEVLKFARTLNDTAALRSTGMGLGQVMGSNHARIGYATPQAMFNAFSSHEYGVNAQIMGYVNYVLSDPGLLAALRGRNWWTAVQKYNGTGQEQLYVNLLEDALEKIQREIGA